MGFPIASACDALSAETNGGATRATRDEGGEAPLDALLVTIEREVIPRLVLAHRGERPAAPQAAVPSWLEVEEFARLLLRDDAEAIARYLSLLQTRGVGLEAIFLELLAPAARMLGRWWEQDRCDFSSVTIALWRLQRVLYDLSPAFQTDARAIQEGRRILLAPTPHEQHTFGLFLVAELLRRDGWEVVAGPAFSHEELVGLVADHWFSAAGLSLAAERWVGGLCEVIADMRRASRNRAIVIIVGGAFFAEHPEMAARVGADAMAPDARRAVELARRFFDRGIARGGSATMR
ncbi:MAG: cobalamin-dependent protein [Burkholderiaceae bacterium]|nr:cobalamin-dependent protein [Burkholderiaceae bacterium]